MCQISVVVPVYNAEKYIEKCIGSILNQTFADIEIIIVNDGSQDRSIDIIQNVFQDRRIRIVNKENAGLPQARKTGFENSTGRYIVFVDADDWIENNMLQLLYEKIETSHADMVCCGVVFDDDNGTRIEEWKVEKETAYNRESAILNLHNSSGVYQFMWNKIFSREIISGRDFPIGHFVGEDYCTLIPIIERAANIIQIPENTYHYVQHGGNMTKAGFGPSFIQAYEHYDNLRKYLLKRYDTCKNSILCYHLSEYMFIVNAMARNGNYRKDMIQTITKYVRKNITRYIRNKHIRKLYRCAAVVMAVNWKIYVRMYKVLMGVDFILADNEFTLIEKISNSDHLLWKIVKKGAAVFSNLQTMFQIRKKGKKIFLLLTPQYDNLGDHAIALSSLEWLQENFPEYSVVDITCNFYKNLKTLLNKFLREDDVICITGGGFMGDLWMITENMARDIIRTYKSNKIIVMPQTVYFQSDEEKKISKEIYTSHKNVYFALRDRDSYSLIKDWLGEGKVIYVPDIVTVFRYNRHGVERQNIGICFREDIEKVDYNLTKEEVVAFFVHNNKQVKEISTLLKLPFVFTGSRKKYVIRKFKEIEHLELIVTNRLHCMIFAYLCGTPCLAFDNKSHKVSGGWEWLKDSGYIKMYNSSISLRQQIDELMECKTNSLHNAELQNRFKEFADVFVKWIEE